MKLLEEHFRVYAVDLRGQGRSTRTPGRYTLDNMGNDLVRFIALEIRRPVIVSGLSSGGVSQPGSLRMGMPGSIRGAALRGPAALLLRGQHVARAVAASVGGRPDVRAVSKYLGDQWSVGDWKGMQEAARRELPPLLAGLYAGGDEPPQNLKEYDPEWARSFWTGAATGGCDHARCSPA